MKTQKIFAGAALAVALVAGPAGADTLLASGTFDGRYYGIYQATTTITWDAAELAAVGLGGHLASIASDAEGAYIYSLIAPHTGALYTTDCCNQLGPWIGGTRTASTGFSWTDGTPFVYTHFGPGEPNNVNGHEFNIHLISPGTDPIDEPNEGSFWNDLSGDTTTIRGYVFERAAGGGGVPEPAAWALMILGFGAAGAALRQRRREVRA